MPTGDWGQAAFAPDRVALVGASSSPGKLGHVLMTNLSAGSQAEVIPVHPTAVEILGRPAYPSLRAIPGTVDLAVVVAPPAACVAIAEDAVVAGVTVLLVITGGFAETGGEGAARQQRISAIAKEAGMRVIGPNCFGVVNASRGLNASLGLGTPASGGISLCTQSGAYGMVAYTRSREEGLGFAKIIATGNTVDIDAADALSYFARDAETRVVALIVESIGDGRRLFEAARAAARRKPIVMLKTGRSRAAKRAAESHTAALADETDITLAAMRQAGVRLVDDGQTLLDVAAALTWQRPLRGRRVAVITNSGGTGVELTDLLESHGLEVPALSAPLQRQIAAQLPSIGSATNPIDVTPDWQRFPDLYGASLEHLLESNEIDAVMPVLLQRSALDAPTIERIIEVTEGARRRGVDKPVHVCWVAPAEAHENRRRLWRSRIPCHEGPARAARVLAGCREAASAEVLDNGGTDLVWPDGHDWLPPELLLPRLSGWGLPVVPWVLASDSAAACRAADDLGYPVVLKAIRSDLVHKFEAGAAILGLGNVEAVLQAADQLTDRFGAGPLMVQCQAGPGVELMVGAVRDPSFGPAVLLGLGGIFAEALDDVVWRLAPFGEAEALTMLATLRAQPMLDGVRGLPPVDRSALARVLSAFSCGVARVPNWQSIDLNPLIAVGDELSLVDARCRMALPE